MGNHEPLHVEETTMGEWARCLTLATMLVAVACGNVDQPAPHDTDTPAAPLSWTAAVDEPLSEPTSVENGPVSTRPVADPTCRRGQRLVVRSVAGRLGQAGGDAASPDLVHDLRAARTNLQEHCGLVPLRARIFLVDALRATRRPRQDTAYRLAILTFERWAEQATGRPPHPSRVRK